MLIIIPINKYEICILRNKITSNSNWIFYSI